MAADEQADECHAHANPARLRRHGQPRAPRLALADGLGAEVSECVDGATALERLRRQAYDLVVTELQLPFMSGLDMLASLRALPRTTTLPGSNPSTPAAFAPVRTCW